MGVHVDWLHINSVSPHIVDLQDCDDYLAKEDGYLCYQVVMAPPSTWTDAQTECRGRSGNIASSQVPPQNAVIRQLVETFRLAEAWLSAREVLSPWKWLNGMLFTDV